MGLQAHSNFQRPLHIPLGANIALHLQRLLVPVVATPLGQQGGQGLDAIAQPFGQNTGAVFGSRITGVALAGLELLPQVRNAFVCPAAWRRFPFMTFRLGEWG